MRPLIIIEDILGGYEVDLNGETIIVKEHNGILEIPGEHDPREDFIFQAINLHSQGLI